MVSLIIVYFQEYTLYSNKRDSSYDKEVHDNLILRDLLSSFTYDW